MQTEVNKRKRKIAPEMGVAFWDNPLCFQDVVARAGMR